MKISYHLDAYYDRDGSKDGGGADAGKTHWYIEAYTGVCDDRPRVVLSSGERPTLMEAFDAMRAALENVVIKAEADMGRGPGFTRPENNKNAGEIIRKEVARRMDTQKQVALKQVAFDFTAQTLAAQEAA